MMRKMKKICLILSQMGKGGRDEWLNDWKAEITNLSLSDLVFFLNFPKFFWIFSNISNSLSLATLSLIFSSLSEYFRNLLNPSEYFQFFLNLSNFFHSSLLYPTLFSLSLSLSDSSLVPSAILTKFIPEFPKSLWIFWTISNSLLSFYHSLSLSQILS